LVTGPYRECCSTTQQINQSGRTEFKSAHLQFGKGILMRDVHQAPTKQEIRTEMDDGLTRFLAVIDRLSDEQMEIPTDAVGWTVRDHIAHLAVWAEGIAALLRREERWAAMGLDITEDDEHDWDVMNEQIARQHRHISPTQARAWLVTAHEQVSAAVESLEDAELAAPYAQFTVPFTGQQGDPIFEYILGNTAHHYAEHTPWIEAIVRDYSA
jgi:hypothetical protein